MLVQPNDAVSMKMRAKMKATTVKVRGRDHLRSARELQNDLIQVVQDAESRAHKLGLHVTGHALNRAKNALGWEIAGNIDQAATTAKAHDA